MLSDKEARPLSPNVSCPSPSVYLRQLQGPHYSGEAEHVSHGALELGGDLDDFMEQTGPLLGRPGAAQHIHGQHDRHGLKPAGAWRVGGGVNCNCKGLSHITVVSSHH